MKKKKQIYMSLGALTILTVPFATIVSCSHKTSTSKKSWKNLVPAQQSTSWTNLVPAQQSTSWTNLVPAQPIKKATAWKTNTFGPFLDMGSYSHGATSATTGKRTPKHLINDLGIKHIMLGFVQMNNSGTTQGPAWGGCNAPFTGDGWDTKRINGWISAYQKLGGSIGISFGGADGTPIWSKTTPEKITSYLELAITTYNVKNIDFDIEKGGFGLDDKKDLGNLVTAINNVQTKYSGVDVSLTLQSQPSPNGLNDSFVSNKCIDEFNKLNKMPIINIMAMDFGDAYYNSKTTTMAKACEESANAVAKTVSAKLPKFKLLPQQILQTRFGITPMIGKNDGWNAKTHNELFGFDDVVQLSKWAKSQHIYWMGFWALTRDYAGTGGGSQNSGIPDQKDLQFATTFLKNFGDSE